MFKHEPHEVDLLIDSNFTESADCSAAKTWLHEHHVNYNIVDVATNLITAQEIETWLRHTALSNDAYINTTDAETRDKVADMDHKQLANYLIEHLDIMRWPVLRVDRDVIAFGFDASVYADNLTDLNTAYEKKENKNNNIY